MSTIKERYMPTIIAANGSANITSEQTGGFLCTVSGTLNLDNRAGTAIINDLPVTAGVYYPLPFYLGKNGGTLTLSGGAAGTLGV